MALDLFCASCGSEVPGRPPEPSYAVCPGCLAIVRIDAPASDVFAMRISDLAAPTQVLQAASKLRARIRGAKARAVTP
jgi:hypothetical protein